MTLKLRVLGAAAIVVLAVLAVFLVWWHGPPDPRAELLRRSVRFAGAARDSATAMGAGLEHWRIATADGEIFHALWRPAPPGTEQPWTVVMMGGLGTGQRAAAILPAHVPAHVLAVDWPWHGPRRLSTFDAIRRLGAIRDAVLRSPGVLALGVEAAAAQPEVSRERIVVLGASLGAPITMATLRLTDVPAALVLIDGFADLGHVLDHALRREVHPSALASPLAAYAARLLHSIEPAHHTSHAASLPTLVLNARDDERIPLVAIDRLWAALPHAERRWREGTHVRAHRSELIATLSDDVSAWLAGLD